MLDLEIFQEEESESLNLINKITLITELPNSKKPII
jgi:hypothetical protein